MIKKFIDFFVNDNKKKSINISWVVVLLCIIFTFFSIYMMRIYSIFHWNIFPVAIGFGAYVTPEEKLALSDNTIDSEKNRFINTQHKKFVEGCGEIFGQVSIYSLLGFIGFIFSIIPFFLKPRWIGFVSLPIGLFGLFITSMIM